MPDLTFTSKGAAEASRDLNSINAAAKEMQRAFADDTRAAKDLDAAVRRIYQSKDAAKQFQAEFAKLNTAFHTGKVDAGLYAANVASLKKAFSEASGPANEIVNAVSGAFDVGKLTTWITSFAGVGALVKEVTAEYRAQVEMIDRAAATQLDVGASRDIFIRNTPQLSEAEQRRLIDQNTRVAALTGVSESIINQARAGAWASLGGDEKATLDATYVSARYLPDQPSAIPSYTGRLADVASITGSKNAIQNQGYLTTLMGQSRITNPELVGTNLVPAIVAAVNSDSTAAEAGALAGAITTSLKDANGSTGGTALTQVASQLEKFMPDTPMENLSLGSRMEKLWGDRALADKFFASAAADGFGASFDAKANATLRTMLTDRNSEFAQAYLKNRAEYDDSAGLQAKGYKSLGRGANRLEPVAEATRALDIAVEQARTEAQQLLPESARRNIVELKQRAGYSNLGAESRAFVQDVIDGRVGLDYGDGAELLKGDVRMLRGRQYVSPGINLGSGGNFGGVGGPTGYYRAPNAEEKSMAAILERAVEVLERLDKSNEEIKKNTAKKNTVVVKEGGIRGGNF